MQDGAGRSVIFHGVNIVYKVHPYIPQRDVFDSQLSLTDAELDDLVKWGFNFVRLGVMWEAVERSPDTYNETYLDDVEGLINRLGQRGIYTLVDAHQDVLARKICGEGMPNFYATDLPTKCGNETLPWLAETVGVCKSIQDYGFRFDSDGNPLIEDCQKHNFAGYYPSPESVALFERLYTNESGLQDKFINYWKRVALRFANNPYIIGYDPLNEPFPANFYKDPSIIYTPGKFDNIGLEPLYARAYNEAYIPADSSKIMFFEPTQFPDTIGLLGGLIPNLGFSAPPGGENNSTKHVLNDHSYCCQLSPEICATGEPDISKASVCREWHEKRVATRSNDADRYGIPLFFSEFGACLNSSACVQEITSFVEVCDEHLAGWAYWQLKNYADLTTSAGTQSEGFYNNDGTLQDGKVKSLTRAYLPATQGILQSMTFHDTTSDFLARFIVQTSITEPTIAYLNEDYWYNTGFTLQLSTPTGRILQENVDFTLDLSQRSYAKFVITNTKLNGQSINVLVSVVHADIE